MQIFKQIKINLNNYDEYLYDEIINTARESAAKKEVRLINFNNRDNPIVKLEEVEMNRFIGSLIKKMDSLFLQKKNVFYKIDIHNSQTIFGSVEWRKEALIYRIFFLDGKYEYNELKECLTIISGNISKNILLLNSNIIYNMFFIAAYAMEEVCLIAQSVILKYLVK